MPSSAFNTSTSASVEHPEAPFYLQRLITDMSRKTQKPPCNHFCFLHREIYIAPALTPHVAPKATNCSIDSFNSEIRVWLKTVVAA
jgi:hypothetical protein